jgi:hypothetical protein
MKTFEIFIQDATKDIEKAAKYKRKKIKDEDKSKKIFRYIPAAIST